MDQNDEHAKKFVRDLADGFQKRGHFFRRERVNGFVQGLGGFEKFAKGCGRIRWNQSVLARGIRETG